MASDAEQVFYKLSELASLIEVETSVLRYWEKEFGETLRPLKMGPRKRLYRPEDLETFREIKRLLHEDRYTIAGAKRRLSQEAPEETPAGAELTTLRAVLAETRRDLLALRQLLASGPLPGRRPKKP